jgi:hypothetical protein
MSTTYGATGLGQTAASTRRDSPRADFRSGSMLSKKSKMPPNGNEDMLHRLWTSKGIALAGALAVAGTVLSVGLASPEPVASAALGPEWQCSRIAFVLTTCTRIEQAGRAAPRVRKEEAKEADRPPRRRSTPSANHSLLS